jgi:hypothetical protein
VYEGLTIDEVSRIGAKVFASMSTFAAPSWNEDAPARSGPAPRPPSGSSSPAAAAASTGSAGLGPAATGWRIRIHGDAPFDVRMPFPVPLDGLASFAAISGAVMHPLVAEIDDDTLRADLHELARRLVRLPNRRRR